MVLISSCQRISGSPAIFPSRSVGHKNFACQTHHPHTDAHHDLETCPCNQVQKSGTNTNFAFCHKKYNVLKMHLNTDNMSNSHVRIKIKSVPDLLFKKKDGAKRFFLSELNIFMRNVFAARHHVS